MLAGLDATVADLESAPPLRMPIDVAARLDTVIAAETAQQRTGRIAPVTDLAARRRWRRPAFGAAATAAAAAIVVGGVVVSGSGSDDDGTPLAAPPPLPLTAATIADGLQAGLTGQDFGPLADPAVRQGCLRANGVGGEPVGARRVVVDERPGVLMVLTTGELGRFRLLVVGEDCGSGTPARIADRVVGR